eukprot:Sspe_Gene.34178::Locus_16627_Transcript_1_1_Confidence_1.000_Length_1147::g.34178::m.34178
MDIVLIAPVRAATGNNTTAERLRCLLDGSYKVSVVNSGAEDAVAQLRCACSPSTAAVIVLHAWRSGKVLLDWVDEDRLQRLPPVVLIFGGTDVNEMVHEVPRLGEMTRVVSLSACAVCFSDDLKRKACSQWPQCNPVVIPQSVVVAPPGPDPEAALSALAGDSTSLVVLLPMGIRAVKDPVFAATAFRRLQDTHPNLRMVVVGPPLDSAVMEELRPLLSPQVLYHPQVEQEVLHACFRSRRVVGVVNCSRSEGQPQAVLEGMMCGAPALLRAIPGNLAVADESTAVFFSTEDEFVHGLKRLVDDEPYRTNLASAGQRLVTERYHRETERSGYLRLLGELIQHRVDHSL